MVPESEVLQLYDPSRVEAVVKMDPKRRKSPSSSIKRVVLGGDGITGQAHRLAGTCFGYRFVSWSHVGEGKDIVDRSKREGVIQDLDEDTWKKIYAKRKPEISLRSSCP